MAHYAVEKVAEDAAVAFVVGDGDFAGAFGTGGWYCAGVEGFRKGESKSPGKGE